MSRKLAHFVPLNRVNFAEVSFHQLAIIDPTVEDYPMLAAGVVAGVEVIILDRNRDGVEQISEILSNRSNLEALHIVSHGSPGTLYLGSTQLSLETLNRYGTHLQQWDADNILFYGCNVAAGDAGAEFIAKLHQLTGAKIAAATTPIGNAELGGNWNLAYTTGKIETSLAFPAEVMRDYSFVLAELVKESFTGTSVSGPWIYGTTGTSADPGLTAGPGPNSPLLNIGSEADGTGALRLTANVIGQSGFVIYNQPISSTDGVEVTFDFFAYNGNGADGLSFFLIDGNATPTAAGAGGSSLGYANYGLSPGLVGGYVGIGFDAYGGFSSTGEHSTGLGPSLYPDSVAIRGSESSEYQYITSASVPGGIDNPFTTIRDNALRRVQIQLTPSNAASPNNLSVAFDLNLDGDFTDPGETVIAPFDITATNGAVPTTFKFGFAASTGGLTNIHEVRNLSYDIVRPTADIIDVTPNPRNSVLSSITIQFSTAVTGFDVSDLSFTRNGSAVSLAGATLSTTDSITWSLDNISGLTGTEGNYQLTLNASDSDIFSSLGGRGFEVSASDTWTVDVTAPILTALTPADDATSVAINSNLVLTFSESITAGTGNLTIKKVADNSVVETIAVTSPNVTISDNTVTITPNNLESGTGYYIAIDATAIIDEVGNAFAGIDNNTTWNFTTADAPPEDPPGVTLSQTALSVTEGGATATYTVVLNSQPTADVAIAFETGNQLEPIANITFTSTNWNQTQTITVTAIDDTEVEGDHSGTITHTVTSTDANYDGITIAQVTASITDNDIANTPPVVGTPIPDNSATAGEPFSLTLPANTFRDPDGDPLTFTATLENGGPLPAWLTFNPATRNFSGTPTDSDLGSLNIKVTANDGTAFVADTFTLTVGEVPNTPPVVGTPLPDNSATSGEPFSLTLPANTFSDADGDELTFTATLENGDPLPAWVTFDPLTGTFSGTPTDADLGSLNITVTANDGTTSVADTFTLGVSQGVLSEPPEPPALFVPLGPTGPTAFANFIAGLPDLEPQLTSPITDIDCNCPPMPLAPMVNLGLTPTIPVTEGDDILIGSDFGDAMTGFGGNDVIYGFGGDDLIVGDSGNDLLFGATGNDIIAGSTGDDVIYAGKGDDLVYAGQDNDFVYGDLGNDTLLGDKGNDIIFGGTSDLSLADLDGNDLIYGGEGDDQLHGNVGNDSLSGGVGDDLLRGGQNDDLLHGDEGNDILWGDNGSDILCGGDGNDTLYGGNGSETPSTESDNDYLCGGNGEDWLIGGLGENTLIGGAGSDRFILHNNGGTDLILDFTDGVDLIGLSQGLSVDNLAITQGDVGTFITVDNQLLAILNNVNASTITADDFFSFA